MNRTHLVSFYRVALAVFVSSGLWACSSSASSIPLMTSRLPAGTKTVDMLTPNTVRPRTPASTNATASPSPSPSPVASAAATTVAAPPAAAAKTTQMLTEVPHAASAFTSSVGVNVDLPDMPSATASPAADRLKALGIGHVRIAILRQDTPYNTSVAAFLAKSGAMADGVTNCAPPLGPYAAAVITANDISSFNTAIGNKLEAYEAMNEPDQQSANDPNWVSDLNKCMQGQENAIAGLPFFGPAISDENGKAQALGDQSANITMGNLHRYLSGNNPGTAGFGNTNSCGMYPSLSWAMCEARIVSGAKPINITEMGYNSDSEVDLTTQGKYLSRAIFVNSNAGVARTYFYCLISYTGADGFGGDGLLNTDLTPKPAYTAIQSVMNIMADRSSALNSTASAAPLTYTISGAPSTLQHELIEKSDGSYALALWNETSSWNPNAKTPTAVPATPITVTLTSPVFSVTPWSLDDAGAKNHPTVSIGLRGFTVPVDDHITIVQFAKRPSIL